MSLKKLLFFITESIHQMWFRCCLYCLLALVPFAVGPSLSDFIPKGFQELVSEEALLKILTVLATSMLAVTTFSLSIMVQALHTASTTATPRASRLLMENSPAQNALGAFIGSFLFSITGIIGMSAGFYSEDVISTLFILTIAMLVLIIVMLLQWIKQLSQLGRVSITIRLIEDALEKSINSYRSDNALTKTSDLSEEDKESLEPLCAPNIGYVRYIDYAELANIAKDLKTVIHVDAVAGDFLDGLEPVAYLSDKVNDTGAKAILATIVIHPERSFSQDPRYGFATLSEVALRALSPGINDPGTAVDAIRSQYRVLNRWLTEGDKNHPSDKAHEEHTVYARQIQNTDLYSVMLLPLVSHASQHLTVALALRHILEALSEVDPSAHKKTLAKWIEKLDDGCAQNFDADQLKSFHTDVSN